MYVSVSTRPRTIVHYFVFVFFILQHDNLQVPFQDIRQQYIRTVTIYFKSLDMCRWRGWCGARRPPALPHRLHARAAARAGEGVPLLPLRGARAPLRAGGRPAADGATREDLVPEQTHEVEARGGEVSAACRRGRGSAPRRRGSARRGRGPDRRAR